MYMPLTCQASTKWILILTYENFHMSVHGLNIYVAQMIFGGATHVNVNHMIHDLSFGPKYPGLHNPLDGTVRILHDTSGTQVLNKDCPY